jgi:hypothetical protein
MIFVEDTAAESLAAIANGTDQAVGHADHDITDRLRSGGMLLHMRDRGHRAFLPDVMMMRAGRWLYSPMQMRLISTIATSVPRSGLSQINRLRPRFWNGHMTVRAQTS